MSYPDWKAFESGELDSSSRSIAERLLSESDHARLDYAGYQEYRTVLRQAVLAEPAPLDRLESILRKSAAKTRLPRFMTPLFAGAVVLALALFLGPRMVRQPTSEVPSHEQVAKLATHDPKEAYNWIGKEVGFMIPPYRLTNVAKLMGASAGKGWGAFEYECDGKPIKLIIRPNSYQFDLPKKELIGRTTFWVGDSIGFKCPYCAYEMKGADEKTRWKLAKAAAIECLGGL